MNVIHTPGPAGIAITALGAASSLGIDVDTSCAAARAGIVRPAALPYYLDFDASSNEVTAIYGHPVGSLTTGFQRLGRLARLAALALADLVTNGALGDADLREAGVVLNAPSGFYLNAAEAIGAANDEHKIACGNVVDTDVAAMLRQRYEADLIGRMFALPSLARPAVVEILFNDQAGGANALIRGLELLRQGAVRRCIVGGVDSYLDPEQIDALVTLKLLKAADNPVGFTPGEACALLLLESPEAARRRSVEPAARITSIALDDTGRHQFSGSYPDGKRLASTLNSVAAQVGQDCGLLIGGCNGTEWVAHQWGSAQLLIAERLRQLPHWFPAAAFGETGAATELLACCMAARAWQRGYGPLSGAAIWALSANGLTSSISLTATN